MNYRKKRKEVKLGTVGPKCTAATALPFQLKGMDGHSAAGLTKIDDNQVSWPFLLSFSLSVLNALLQADSLPILREWRAGQDQTGCKMSLRA